jgi:hypothetical protein
MSYKQKHRLYCWNVLKISGQKFNPPSFGEQKENFVSVCRATMCLSDSILMWISANETI